MKLGSVTVHLKDLLRAKDMTVNRPFQLRGADPQSKIQMQLCLRVNVPCKHHIMFTVAVCLCLLQVVDKRITNKCHRDVTVVIVHL